MPTQAEKIKIFKLIIKSHPEFAGALAWSYPNNEGLRIKWTRTDRDLFESLGGTIPPLILNERRRKSSRRKRSLKSSKRIRGGGQIGERTSHVLFPGSMYRKNEIPYGTGSRPRSNDDSKPKELCFVNKFTNEAMSIQKYKRFLNDSGVDVENYHYTVWPLMGRYILTDCFHPAAKYL